MKSAWVFLFALSNLLAQEPRFFQWSNNRAANLLSQRAAVIANIKSVDSAEARKAEVRAKILQLIGGIPQVDSPLDAQITGGIDQGAYWIQKILYQSRPGLIVSANLYLPKTGGLHPAVLFQIGHFRAAKAYDQVTPGNLAMKGFVVLAFDPIGEGERLQGYNPVTQTSLAQWGVTQHLMAGGPSILLGQNFARYEIFDAQRAIDYLVSRPEVDPNRIGATGCSGGGTLTTYLSMLDPRIKVAAPACYLNSFTYEYPKSCCGDSEQSFSGLLSSGLDMADFVELFSPKPWLIVSTQGDQIPLAGTQLLYNEVSRWYGLYGAANNLKWVVGPGPHGTPLQDREAIYAWMIHWLNDGVGDSTEQPVNVLPVSDLQASDTGQVGGEEIFQVIAATPREPQTWEQLLSALPQWVSVPNSAPAVTLISQSDSGTYTTESISFETEPGLTLEAELLIPHAAGHKPAVVFIETLALGSPGAVELASAGNIVLDLLPTGEPSGADYSTYQGDWITNFRAFLIGIPLPGMRAHDILQALRILQARSDVNRAAVSGSASGVSGFWLLLAAAADPGITAIQLNGTPYSFQPALEAPVQYSLHDAAIAGFYKNFDIPDLVAALGNRAIHWTNPSDWLLNGVQPSILSPSLSAKVFVRQYGPVHDYQLTVTVTNAGPGMAINPSITKLAFKTLAGTGVVSSFSNPPIEIPTLRAGEGATFSLSVQVPSTVQRFLITESGTDKGSTGAPLKFSMSQTVTP